MHRSQKGFTLIELVLYASLVSLLMVGVTSFWSIVKDVGIKNKSISAVEEQGAFVADLISEKTRVAGAVCTPATSGESDTALDLDTDCDRHTENEITFSLNGGGILVMAEGGGTEVPITDDRTYISSIEFTNATDPLGGPTNVNYTFTMQSKNYSATSEYRYQKTFSGGATMRLE